MYKITYKKEQVLLFFVLLIVFSSCVSKKDIIYFQNDSINQAEVSNSYQTIFKPDDLLQITISSQNVEATKDFNLPSVSFRATTNAVTAAPTQQSYLVDSKGEIDFPVLGKIKIGGLTREETILLFKELLDPAYVKDPNINIRIANFKVSVMGDVKNPGSFTIPNERITILDALALAGDTNISARRDNIKIIREEDNKKVFYEIDLRSNKIFTSPVYYLQQNDYIYVEQNYAKIQSASSNSNTSLFISLTGLVITIISILTR